MTTTQTSTTRPTFAVCPPWCAGHDRLFQPWDAELMSGEQFRNHGSEGAHFRQDWSHPVMTSRVVPNVGVELLASETIDGAMTAPGVRIYSEGDPVVTPATARLLAQALIEAADRAESTR